MERDNCDLIIPAVCLLYVVVLICRLLFVLTAKFRFFCLIVLCITALIAILLRLRFLWSPYVIGQTIIFSCCGLFMVALCNRETIYIFMLFLSSSSSSFFSSPNLSGRRLDVYHTLAHGVALVRI